MPELLLIVIITWASGASALVGAFLACFESSRETERKQELLHGITAFGGGALLAAVAFSLAPHAMKTLSLVSLSLTFLAGGLVFCVIDAFLAKRKGSIAQFLAMMMDYLPEAMSLGAVFSQNRKMGWLLAGFIGLQNLPEGFNAFREMRSNHLAGKKILWAIFIATVFGPIAAWLGYTWLQEQEVLTAAIMSFASGGILYLIFQDIAPQAVMRTHWMPPLGAVLGFMLGMLGSALMG
ncbi:ZIP family metal transporter [Gilvimarinus agarilyticus]|uniref:ZIP family metal transporter n=1 Tax=unclassified Gilvimarinus TaxID=2642066 RepID=UPI001C094A9F|nr:MULTISPECIES: ZIP family metal transporter [unclassified Gilvimarinus]MBU2886873.1 ZIP family metal transporter [Gilvimarinus agarilyticus]MDO6571534.1 ZIP family metal transporter [Gilvimarinus sp. 2_MG-2023]MDO6747943.1 ZIP family metal transporter [Gilvimarinus sp. 1_MG-2023]